MSNNQLDSILVGKAISKARQNKGITQEVLSGLADIGRTHLSAIERGLERVTTDSGKALELQGYILNKSFPDEEDRPRK